MKKILVIITLVLFSLVFLGIMVFGGTYNSLVRLDESVDGQWAQVENVYQRRADLIPNLVETVKGYASHERETLEAVVKARAQATSVNVSPDNLSQADIQKFQQAQGGLRSALGRLMVVIEKYPDLKANQNFQSLQAQLEGTENRITFERKTFNEKVKSYNTEIRIFPKSIIAGMMGFQQRGYFQAEQGAEQAPKVKF